jgi:hypothetical protein
MTAKEYKEQPHVTTDSKIFIPDGYQQLFMTYCLQVLKININPRRGRKWKSGGQQIYYINQIQTFLKTISYILSICQKSESEGSVIILTRVT